MGKRGKTALLKAHLIGFNSSNLHCLCHLIHYILLVKGSSVQGGIANIVKNFSNVLRKNTGINTKPPFCSTVTVLR